MANIMKTKNSNAGLTTTGFPMPFGSFVDRALGNTLNRFFDDEFWGFNGISGSGNIPVNIRETDDSYEMEVVAPGLRKEDFNVNISDNMLTVSFEHKEEREEENKHDGYLRREYRMQSFNRSFTLDDTMDAEKINAQYKDGVLYVTLPKKEGVKKITKNIQVQ